MIVPNSKFRSIWGGLSRIYLRKRQKRIKLLRSIDIRTLAILFSSTLGSRRCVCALLSRHHASIDEHVIWEPTRPSAAMSAWSPNPGRSFSARAESEGVDLAYLFLLTDMKFAAAVFLSVALLHAAFAAPVAEANELARRTSPGSGSYSSWRDIVDGADEVIDLTRRTSPGGSNYIGYHDIVNDASSED